MGVRVLGCQGVRVRLDLACHLVQLELRAAAGIPPPAAVVCGRVVVV